MKWGFIVNYLVVARANLDFSHKSPTIAKSMSTGSQTEHEQATIKAFVSRYKQERFLTFLSKPKTRKKLTQELANFRWFDPRFATAIPWKVDPTLGLWQRRVQGIENVYRLLKSKGAGKTCWVMGTLTSTGRNWNWNLYLKTYSTATKEPSCRVSPADSVCFQARTKSCYSPGEFCRVAAVNRRFHQLWQFMSGVPHTTLFFAMRGFTLHRSCRQARCPNSPPRSSKRNPNRAGPGLGNCITCPVTRRLSPATRLNSMLPKGTPCPESPNQSPYPTWETVDPTGFELEALARRLSRAPKS